LEQEVAEIGERERERERELKASVFLCGLCALM
jgi:hypothetical protein